MTSMQGLVGDIGGTHARFAIAEVEGDHARLRDPEILDNTDYTSAEAAIDAYLAKASPRHRPDSVVLSVAGPVTHGAMHFTNLDWDISEDRLRRSGFHTARLVNDFAAQALGAPRTARGKLRRIGPEVEGEAEETLAVLGPGTGFGVAALARQGGREMVLSTEGGHAGFVPLDETEIEIWRWFAKRHGRVSIERVMSGPGFYELYLALAEIAGAKPAYADGRQVQAAAAGDALAEATADRFCRILGATAGDIALGLGARGGVYVTGGVAVSLVDRIASGGFRARFEDKGRFQHYMADIPTFVVLEPYAALIGAASLLEGRG